MTFNFTLMTTKDDKDKKCSKDAKYTRNTKTNHNTNKPALVKKKM